MTATRQAAELKFEPEGEDNGQPPATFRLICWRTPQQQHHYESGVTWGWIRTGPAERDVLAEGITRGALAALIADAADWLAWDGTQ